MSTENAGPQPRRTGRPGKRAAPLGERARLGAQCLSAPPPSPAASAGRLASGLCPRIPGNRFPGTPWLPRCCPGRSAFRVWLQLGLNFTHQSKRPPWAGRVGGGGWISLTARERGPGEPLGLVGPALPPELVFKCPSGTVQHGMISVVPLFSLSHRLLSCW